LPSESLQDRSVRMLSDDNPFEVKNLEIEGRHSIEIIWLKGLSLPHTRSLFQIVNGRAVRDRTLQTAILNPLKQSFLPGNFPACVVKIDLPADELDVNVHPAKTEIRFLEPGKIFALCNAAFQKLLDQDRIPESGSGGFSIQLPSFMLHSPSHFGGEAHFPSSRLTSQGHTPFLELSGNPGQMTSFIDETPIGNYRGVLFSTYFVFEKGDDLTLIDQHAAHERIRYEQLKSKILRQESIETQALLVPEVVKFPQDRILELKPRLGLLDSMGFDVEVFSDESILFRSIPAIWGNRALTERLRNLLERLLVVRVDPENMVWDETLFEKIAMEACRSSFKAGDSIETSSALDLTRKLFLCEHPGNCPHGRPTSVRIQKTKVEEWFNRLS
ncbi:MAG: hypothetical protein KGP28_11140, partial [Bdellovibrionales bacterium]|nr:hypothetical protein [Bdellovibrionales bacterium]